MGIYCTPDDLPAHYSDDPRGINEARADHGEAALYVATDCNADDDPGETDTDMSDALATLHHAADRMGIDWTAVCARGERAYRDDVEDGPHVVRDLERFPEPDDNAPTTCPVVLCVRDPDESNGYQTWPGHGSPIIIDVDLGSSFDGEPDSHEQWSDWSGSFSDDLATLKGHPAGDALREILDGLEPERDHHDDTDDDQEA